jgi:hypothetical protein
MQLHEKFRSSLEPQLPSPKAVEIIKTRENCLVENLFRLIPEGGFFQSYDPKKGTEDLIHVAPILRTEKDPYPDKDFVTRFMVVHYRKTGENPNTKIVSISEVRAPFPEAAYLDRVRAYKSAGEITEPELKNPQYIPQVIPLGDSTQKKVDHTVERLAAIEDLEKFIKEKYLITQDSRVITALDENADPQTRLATLTAIRIAESSSQLLLDAVLYQIAIKSNRTNWNPDNNFRLFMRLTDLNGIIDSIDNRQIPLKKVKEYVKKYPLSGRILLEQLVSQVDKLMQIASDTYIQTEGINGIRRFIRGRDGLVRTVIEATSLRQALEDYHINIQHVPLDILQREIKQHQLVFAAYQTLMIGTLLATGFTQVPKESLTLISFLTFLAKMEGVALGFSAITMEESNNEGGIPYKLSKIINEIDLYKNEIKRRKRENVSI